MEFYSHLYTIDISLIEGITYLKCNLMICYIDKDSNTDRSYTVKNLQQIVLSFNRF